MTAPPVGRTDAVDAAAIGLRKARGAFFTPVELCDYLCRWAIRHATDRVLESARVGVRDAEARLSAAIDDATSRARRPGSPASATVDPAAGRKPSDPRISDRCALICRPDQS